MYRYIKKTITARPSTYEYKLFIKKCLFHISIIIPYYYYYFQSLIDLNNIWDIFESSHLCHSAYNKIISFSTRIPFFAKRENLVF